MMRDFLLAVGYFTRIPVPDHPNFSATALQRAALYFPLVGLLIGALLAAIYSAFTLLWPPPLAVVITLCAGFLLTGGFHEDGWADTIDGLGGGFQREQKLTIMTDSRLGTYGSLALWGLLTAKAIVLTQLLPTLGALLWVVVHPLSRWVAMTALVFLPYAKTGPSKAGPIVQQLSIKAWIGSGLCCLVVGYIITPYTAVAIAGILSLTTLLWIWFIRQQLGGYTGDTLGAHQQLSELAILLTLSALS